VTDPVDVNDYQVFFHMFSSALCAPKLAMRCVAESICNLHASPGDRSSPFLQDETLGNVINIY